MFHSTEVANQVNADDLIYSMGVARIQRWAKYGIKDNEVTLIIR